LRPQILNHNANARLFLLCLIANQTQPIQWNRIGWETKRKHKNTCAFGRLKMEIQNVSSLRTQPELKFQAKDITITAMSKQFGTRYKRNTL